MPLPWIHFAADEFNKKKKGILLQHQEEVWIWKAYLKVIVKIIFLSFKVFD